MTLPFISPLPNFQLRKTPLEHLPGYRKDDLKTAVQAWEHSCAYLLSLPSETSFLFGTNALEWQCVARLYLDFSCSRRQEPEDFREYLSRFFEAYELLSHSSDERLFTGYYEPELRGARSRKTGYTCPVYGRPPGLIVVEDLGIFRQSLEGHRIAGFVKEGTLAPAPSRQQIERGAFGSQSLEICWVQDALDLYFMHIQGNGRILFEDGSWTRLRYDGTNGHAYHSLGAEMIARGLIAPEEVSMQNIKNVLRSRCSPDFISTLLSVNASYVFFRETGASEGPVGRIGRPLTPMRSLAVDPRIVSLGMPLWVSRFDSDSYSHSHSDSDSVLSGFMTAQDVGGAIKGLIRGDIFCGTGETAGALAGRLKQEGRLFVFLPKKDMREKI